MNQTAYESGVCIQCGRTVTRGAGGYLRDDDPDPGDGLGGDASCHAREPIAGRMQMHQLDGTLEAIADMLRTPGWSVGMLEDIADLVRAAGYDLDRKPVNEYYHH